MRYLAFLFTFICFFSLSAQDSVYTRQVISTLCQDNFKGRGYIGNGDKKAAAYIQKQFKNIGLSPVNGSYLQKFKFPVNTLPYVEITYNGKKLIPGVDYLVDAASPGINFEGTVQFIPYDLLMNNRHYDSIGLQLSEVVLDTFTDKYSEDAAISLKKYVSDRKKKLIIRLSNSKLTWSSSPTLNKYTSITIRDEIFDRSKPAEFKIRIKNKFHTNYTSQNVLGFIPGSDPKYKDSFIVFTAHYDHLGMMGKAMFPGANDNASGIAMLLNLAKYYKSEPQKYSILFIAFSGEETGLIGSHYFVLNPKVPLPNIRFLINIDLMANGADGIMVVNGLVFPSEYKLLKAINDQENYLPAVKVRGKAANSDHYFFSEEGVPCFFFYLMGEYPYYHDVNDKPEMVPLTNFNGAFELFVKFTKELQK